MEVVEFLVSAGADINAINNDGWTPLIYAAREGHIEVVKFLVSVGADIHIKVRETPNAA